MPDFPDEAPIGYEDPSLRPHSFKRKKPASTCLAGFCVSRGFHR